MYNATCNLETYNSSNCTHKFICSFKTPKLFNYMEIYKPNNISNFELLNWPEKKIIIKNDTLCTKNEITPINYNYSICDMNSENISFEIELNSSLKEGIIKNKTIMLNITQPNSINNQNCTFINRNLNSSIILNCTIFNLSQENRITNGINIEGIMNNGFSIWFLITENDEYIKLINFKENIFQNIECPKKYEIKHCKNLSLIQKKCEQCYKNYYLNGSKTQCLTCSQINEGCNSCFGNGTCKECINEFELKNDNCTEKEKQKKCNEGEYGSECKKCDKLNLNCDECNKSGYCKKCKKGYYLSGIDSNSKCLKCLSTCEECESLNVCTKCKEGLILNKDSCVTCLSLNEGCEECSQINNKCKKCYNNKMLKYELTNNHKCKKKNENENNNNNKNQNKTNLQFERFDSYEKEDNKVNFKPHFILLDNFLYNSTLYITIIIRVTIINNNLRYLQNSKEIEKNVSCSQYGDSLGSNNEGGYLANFKCSLELKEEEEIESMEPKKMEIKDKDNSTIQSFESENKVVNVNELETTSLDEEYKDIKFNKISINDISDIELKNKENLSFNIIGNLDSEIVNKIEYEISLKDNNNKKINATCTFENNNLDNQTISCNALADKDSKELTIINGVYSSKSNNDRLILNNDNDGKIVIPENKKKSSLIGIIIGIVLAALVIISIAIILIIKMKKKGPSMEIKENYTNKKIEKNIDNSKGVIII